MVPMDSSMHMPANKPRNRFVRVMIGVVVVLSLGWAGFLVWILIRLTIGLLS